MKSYSKRIEEKIFKFRNSIHFISAEELAQKSSPNKWSRKEIIGHLIDSARYNLQRFNEIPRSETKYVVGSYTQDALVKQNDYQNTDLQDLIFLWQALNKQISRTISLIDEEALKIKIEAYGEEQDLNWLINDYVEHMEHHLGQILKEAPTSLPDNFPFHINMETAAFKLSNAPEEFLKLMEFGDLEVEYYKPNKIDKQQPHDRDELYFVSKGEGAFIMEEQRVYVKAGDMLFVKAKDAHRFVNFSEDFETWVVFYGMKR